MTNSKELIERLRDCAQEAGRISQDPLVAQEDRSGFVIFEQAFADAAKQISELREALKPFADLDKKIALVFDGIVGKEAQAHELKVFVNLYDIRTARAKLEWGMTDNDRNDQITDLEARLRIETKRADDAEARNDFLIKELDKLIEKAKET